ncbi:hypothetical protein LX81_02062 [Palleronia aestuarii]|uniref:Uncharacterized protein n=1 Tax=Palleronia aestuarii TaxID=568105 RepID=A0A2W7N7V3_9RHOB|nr:hypothetical protein [Palleronia aestuarii]PZX16211.1 hypothetical protein LX81_02062 [Palleronia aestuarii]
MTVHTPLPRPDRGALPVGLIDEADAITRSAIILLRCWCTGGESRKHIAAQFRDVLPAEAARDAVRDFDALMELTLAAARRPLMRHELDCRCMGGDENAFAQMIVAGAAGDHDDALLFACVLMTGPAAFEAGRLSIALGQPFLRLATAHGRDPHPTHSTPASRVH